jgi:phage tail-like protein
MADVLRIDPLGAFNFYLTLIDSSDVLGTLITMAVSYKVAGFSECSGLDATLEVFEIKEGGRNDHVHKFPTRASHGNITLKHGAIFLYDDLWTWHFDFVKGRGKRKDGLVVLLDEARSPAKVWKFTRGIPMKWVGPALNAQQSNVAVESLEIAHEGLELEVGA